MKRTRNVDTNVSSVPHSACRSQSLGGGCGWILLLLLWNHQQQQQQQLDRRPARHFYAQALARPLSSRNRWKHRPLSQRSSGIEGILSVELDLWNARQPPNQKGGGDLLSFTHIIGSDDSGGGCIAGPIVTASVCLLRDSFINTTTTTADLPLIISGVADSKLLSASDRQRIYQHITNSSQSDTYMWSFATRSNQEIDQLGLANATMDCFLESIELVANKLLIRQTAHQSPLQTPPTTGSPTPLRLYSIVDGKHSPKQLSIQSRPWVNADATVYTCALASIVARVIRDNIMRQVAKEYPDYGFENHGGYPTKLHTLALHKLGPCPLHRQSSKPVQSRAAASPLATNGVSRDQFLVSFIAATATTASVWGARPEPSVAMTVDPKTKILLPDKGEIEAAVPTDWSLVDNPLEVADTKSLLGRLDSTSDAFFYADPRFVEHVDEQAVGILTEYVFRIVARDDISSVLDLCTSWTSHVDDVTAKRVSLRRVAGLGMNAKELQANSFLTERTVQDLNEIATLPYKDGCFDVVFCQLSIDYLTKPLDVCQEIGRVLRPGGTVHILFSNRLFLSKAVALWTGADDIDHAYTVACYLHFSKGGFTDIQARDLSMRKGREHRIVGDPLYVVTGTKA